MRDFEKMLSEISKPKVNDLKHQDMLAKQIMRSKNRNAVGFWWLLLPLYLIAALTMKTLYKKTSLKHEIDSFEANNHALSFVLFLLLPSLIILFNAFFSAKRTALGSVLIILSSIVLLIYILDCYV